MDVCGFSDIVDVSSGTVGVGASALVGFCVVVNGSLDVEDTISDV